MKLRVIMGQHMGHFLIVCKMVVWTHCCHPAVGLLSASVKLITQDLRGLSFQLYAMRLLFLGGSTGSPVWNLSRISGVLNLRSCSSLEEAACGEGLK